MNLTLLLVADDDRVCLFCYCSAEMNMTKFLASLGSSPMMGQDDPNYDSIWDHSDVAKEEMEEEEVAEEEMAEEERSLQ